LGLFFWGFFFVCIVLCVRLRPPCRVDGFNRCVLAGVLVFSLGRTSRFPPTVHCSLFVSQKPFPFLSNVLLSLPELLVVALVNVVAVLNLFETPDDCMSLLLSILLVYSFVRLLLRLGLVGVHWSCAADTCGFVPFLCLPFPSRFSLFFSFSYFILSRLEDR